MAATSGLTLELTRTLPAPRSAVWNAMTKPAQLARWWGPKGFTAPTVDFEPRVEGRYRIAMQPPDGELFHLHGEFREVDPPSRLAYTFVWEPPDPDDRETVATLTLRDRGEQTEVSLDQGEFATDERRTLHEGGWSDSFEKLEQLLS
jgi:uncharacterized protein YndB with AHSA1/START domain